MQIAPFEIAIDLVFGDAIDDELLGFLGDAEAFERVFLAELRFDRCWPGEKPVQICPPLRPDAP